MENITGSGSVDNLIGEIRKAKRVFVMAMLNDSVQQYVQVVKEDLVSQLKSEPSLFTYTKTEITYTKTESCAANKYDLYIN